MNIVKYVNARGQVKGVRVWQGGRDTLENLAIGMRAPTMAEADEAMRKRGFHRAGRRWGKRRKRLAPARPDSHVGVEQTAGGGRV